MDLENDKEPVLVVTDKKGRLVHVGHPETFDKKLLAKYAQEGQTLKPLPSQNLEASNGSGIGKIEDGFYYEVMFNGKHCYKYQPPGKEIIIVTHEDKDEAKRKITEMLNSNSQYQASKQKQP